MINTRLLEQGVELSNGRLLASWSALPVRCVGVTAEPFVNEGLDTGMSANRFGVRLHMMSPAERGSAERGY